MLLKMTQLDRSVCHCKVSYLTLKDIVTLKYIG